MCPENFGRLPETDKNHVCLRLLYFREKGEKIQDDPIPARHGKLASFQADFEKEEYQRAIDDMMEYIRAGDIYIANMTQRLFMDSRKDPYDVFRYLRSHNPSPERFLQVRGGQVQTRPVKGTRKRGETRQEDERGSISHGSDKSGVSRRIHHRRSENQSDGNHR